METTVGSLTGVSYRAPDIVYDLIFTTQRMIAFIINQPSDIPWQTPSLAELFVGSMVSERKEQLKLAKIAEERRQSLQGKNPDELLAAYPSNFEIRYDKVTSVAVKRQLIQSQLIFCLTEPSMRGRIIRFNLSKKHITEAQRLTGLVLASKTKES